MEVVQSYGRKHRGVVVYSVNDLFYFSERDANGVYTLVGIMYLSKQICTGKLFSIF